MIVWRGKRCLSIIIYLSSQWRFKDEYDSINKQNSYNFQLDSTNPNASPTYKLQFTYPEGGFDQVGQANAVATFEPDKLNWKYSFTGERHCTVEAFDNGQFTYFQI